MTCRSQHLDLDHCDALRLPRGLLTRAGSLGLICGLALSLTGP